MKNMQNNRGKHFYAVLLLGVLARVVFVLFGAEIYYGSTSFHIGGDTFWWVKNIVNLIEHGVYTDLIGTEYGYFTRTPGYSFFIGFFYLLTGKNVALALKLTVAAQLALDIISIGLIYHISLKIFNKKGVALTTMFLYAFYPFIIIWNVHAYAESLSVFLFLSSILLFLNAENIKTYTGAGIVFSLAVLTRIQLIVFIPFFTLVALYTCHKKYDRWLNGHFLGFLFALLIVYGSWPARNYFGHDKLIFAQHLGDRAHWSPDYMYFMYYIWSVQTDHEPQFTQIIKGEKINFPKASYKYTKDTALLNRIEVLTESCGEGFSYFRRSLKYADTVVLRGNDCNDEIVEIFKTLIEHQKKYNTVNYYLWVPLQNLKKAVFKSELKKAKNKLVYLAGRILFTYRTFLVLAGILALGLLFYRKHESSNGPGLLIVVLYAASWYIFHSFVYRNMEIRFLLQADILLLIPAGWLLHELFNTRVKNLK